MDKVTQQNAANAEESASASEELSAQAATMKEVVDQLVALVGGGASRSGHSGTTRSDRHSAGVGIEHKLHAASKPGAKPRGFGKSDEVLHKIAGHSEKTRAAAKAASTTIPLDDDLTTFNS
jgi:methyl-accepting chemotaxis protein